MSQGLIENLRHVAEIPIADWREDRQRARAEIRGEREREMQIRVDRFVQIAVQIAPARSSYQARGFDVQLPIPKRVASRSATCSFARLFDKIAQTSREKLMRVSKETMHERMLRDS